MTVVDLQKKQLRQLIRNRLALVSSETAIKAGNIIWNQLLTLPEVLRAKNLFSYINFQSEIPTLDHFADFLTLDADPNSVFDSTSDLKHDTVFNSYSKNKVLSSALSDSVSHPFFREISIPYCVGDEIQLFRLSRFYRQEISDEFFDKPQFNRQQSDIFQFREFQPEIIQLDKILFNEQIFKKPTEIAGPKPDLKPDLKPDSKAMIKQRLKQEFCADLELGTFGILEPKTGLINDFSRIVPPDIPDVILIPGLAFDRSGKRLGRGRGFYDRFLPKTNPNAVLIGLAFDFQLFDRLPVEPFDVGIDILLTEKEILRFS